MGLSGAGLRIKVLDVRSSSATFLGLHGVALRVLGGWALQDKVLGP